MSSPRVVVYLLRRDLRIADNPILHEISQSFKSSHPRMTHLLPIYVFPAQQIEISGFIPAGASAKSPFPVARSQVGGFWRCGPHRSRFVAESVWDLKKALESTGSGLEIRVGMAGQIVREVIERLKKEQADVVGVWMTDEEGVEEKREQVEIERAAAESDTPFKTWKDEKYFVDDRDLTIQSPSQLPNVFTQFKKQHEPLRDCPRKTLSRPSKLPPLPPSNMIAPQSKPFEIPNSLDEIIAALHKPLDMPSSGLSQPPQFPSEAKSAHPFHGGETTGHDRIQHLITSGSMTSYKDTRNGMIGTDFSTKLSAWLALGSITARQVHEYLLAFEDGRTDLGRDARGYGQGENKGTTAVRFELLWRDYFRLATRKFGVRLFRVEGFKNDRQTKWASPSAKHIPEPQYPAIRAKIARFLEGRTGNGFVDASMRELFLTGYTSNRLRQNVASFLAKNMGIDWRIGAEWYESMLVDYDLSSNWGNWQYVAGVGNDPRESRMFNTVKQGFDYDPHGDYVKMWIEPLRQISDPGNLFQPWKMNDEEKKATGLAGDEWIEKPLVQVKYDGKRGGSNRGGGGGGYNGRGRGGGGGGYRGRGHGRGDASGSSQRQGMAQKAGFM